MEEQACALGCALSAKMDKTGCTTAPLEGTGDQRGRSCSREGCGCMWMAWSASAEAFRSTHSRLHHRTPRRHRGPARPQPQPRGRGCTRPEA